MRFLKISLAILFTGLFTGLFVSLPVNAQSSHEFVIDELMMEYGPYEECGISSSNISTSWFNYFTQPGFVDPVTELAGVYDMTTPQSYKNRLDSFRQGVLDDTIDWTISVSKESESNPGYNIYTITYAKKSDTYTYIDYNYNDKLALIFNRYNNNERIYKIQIRQSVACGNYRVTALYDRAEDDLPLYTSTSNPLAHKVFISNFIYDYNNAIPGYNNPASPPIPDSYNPPAEPDENLYPQYEYKVQKSQVGMAYHGELTIKYLKNLPHFLTGISTITVSQMTNDWEEIDTTIDSRTVNPAGHLGQADELGVKYSLDELNPGYYMIQITHNQQLDSPPWPANANEKYYVYPVYMQFRWDGQNTVINDNIGCTGICNPELDEKNKYQRYFDTLGLPVGGLQEVILAPLAFIEELPRGHENCEPVFLPLPNGIGVLMLPCMTPIYQQHYNSVFVIYQTILTGLFAYYVSIRMFGNVKELANPKDDGIEAVRL